MAELLLSILAGFLIGLSFSLVLYRFLDSKKLENACLRANQKLYHELLLKKQSQSFQYSPSIRKVINRVHVALLVEHQDSKMKDTSTQKREPSF